MKQALVRLLEKSIRAGIEQKVLPPPVPTRIEVELTKDPGHGDYASNIAMVLAKQAKKNPREIAKILSERIEDRDGLLEKVEIAGPGFLNFFVRQAGFASLLGYVHRQG